ncbi:MAG: DUF4349 domain-containing protein [Candidatus Limnocylindrales bacterium]
MRARRFCFVLLVAGIFAAACSSSSATPGDQFYNQAGPTAAPAMPAASDGGMYGGAGGTQSVPAQPGNANPTDQAPGASSNAVQPENQIIKTGSISIQVAAVDNSIVVATDQIHALGGWLAGSDRTTSTAQEMASATYRVPVARFEDALAAMRRLGTKVLSEHTESTAVGGQIVDLQARIANLKASEKAIQAIMAKATTIADVLTVQQRLADVQGQIEELSGQLAGLTDQAAMSTLTVVFVVPVLPTPSPSPTPTPSPVPTATPVAWSAGDQANQAAGSLAEVGKGAATVLIWIAILLIPVALALIVLLILLGLVARILDPYLKHLLPVTAGGPATLGTPRTPAGSQPSKGQEPRPGDQPKA